LNEIIGNPKDPKAAIIFTTQVLPFETTMYGVFFFYDGEKPPKGAFGPIVDIQPMINLVRVQSYTSLLKENGMSIDTSNLAGIWQIFGGLTPALKRIPGPPGTFGVPEPPTFGVLANSSREFGVMNNLEKRQFWGAAQDPNEKTPSSAMTGNSRTQFRVGF
jgi:hypothetical protein